jgi:hypothetical protein
MKKSNYESPTSEVFELSTRKVLMASGSGSGDDWD